MIALCVIWRRRSSCSISELHSDSQDVAEVDALTHLTADSLQRTSLKGSHAAFRVGCAFLCPPAGYGKTKYKSNSGLCRCVGTSVNWTDWFVHLRSVILYVIPCRYQLE